MKYFLDIITTNAENINTILFCDKNNASGNDIIEYLNKGLNQLQINSEKYNEKIINLLLKVIFLPILNHWIELRNTNEYNIYYSELSLLKFKRNVNPENQINDMFNNSIEQKVGILQKLIQFTNSKNIR